MSRGEFQKVGRQWQVWGAVVVSDFAMNEVFRKTVLPFLAEAFAQVERAERTVKRVRLNRTDYGVSISAWPGKHEANKLRGVFGQSTAVMCDCGAVIGNDRQHPGEACDWWTVYVIMNR